MDTRHVAVWDAIAGGVALVAVTVVLTLDLTAFALLPLALGYALFAVVSWPARVSGRVDAALRRQIDHFVLFGAVSRLASGGLLQLSQIAAPTTPGRPRQVTSPPRSPSRPRHPCSPSP